MKKIVLAMAFVVVASTSAQAGLVGTVVKGVGYAAVGAVKGVVTNLDNIL